MDTKTKLEGTNLKCGGRTYFFDKYEARNKSKYLLLTESRFDKQTETYKRSTFVLFKEDLDKFRKVLGEIRLD